MSLLHTAIIRTAAALTFAPLLCQGAIQPRDLRAHVEFLASDALAGRATPSPSLEVAAAYIEAQFRRAGLRKPENQPAPGPRGRNVIGVLPGSDPRLSKQYVLVTAHYDHVGVSQKGDGDRIHNGANDNASGVASMIEIARELAALKPGPRRTVVFIAYYGEERGLVGSREYAAKPAFPLDQTVVQINLEQTGRTDDMDGPNKATLNVTGYGYSQVAGVLSAAAAPLGVKVMERKKWTDDAFERSDNEALAKKGIPAHTLSVAYMFPDYHRPGDEWEKLDYDNMARVTRAAAAGIRTLANRLQRPKWLNTAPLKYSNPEAAATRGEEPAAASPTEPGKSPASQPPTPPPPSLPR